MATAISTRRVWTYADLEDLPDDGNDYDILGGNLVVRTVPDTNHNAALMELIGMLLAAQEAGYGEVYTTSGAVALDYPERGEAARYVSHPDIFFLRQERAEQLRGDRGWEGVPDLVIEILSRSTLREHRPGGHWWDAYALHGVTHYWLVDTRRRTIQQFALQGRPYLAGQYGDPVTLRPGDVLGSPLFPNISIAVERVFQRVRPDRR